MNKLLIHVHGFLSANEPDRVRALADYIDRCGLGIDVISPRFSNTPPQAFAQLESLVSEERDRRPNVALVGYSLGGYFSTFLAPKYGIKAALVNPVVRGWEILCEYFGACYNEHTGAHFEIGEADISFLTRIYLERLPNPELFLVLLQRGDEILDYREALEYYRECRVVVEDGGCHEFEGFEKQVPGIIDFLFGE